MKTLSEQFIEMGERLAKTEKRVADIQQQNRKQFEANVAEAQAALRSARAAFTARLDKADESLTAQWREVDEAFAAQISRAQRNIDEGLNAIDLSAAQANADDAEAYAELAAEFARVTASEAEAAMVEAKQARANAVSLGKATR